MIRDERQEVLTIDAKDQNVGLFVEPPNKKLEVISKQEKPAMTTLREAAQQALEALQAHGSHAPSCDHLMLLTSLPPQRKPCSCGLGANITALRAALAEPMETVNKTPAQRRERIATAALQGVLANSQWLPPDTTWEQIAAYSVRSADALIAELDKPKEQPK